VSSSIICVGSHVGSFVPPVRVVKGPLVAPVIVGALVAPISVGALVVPGAPEDEATEGSVVTASSVSPFGGALLP